MRALTACLGGAVLLLAACARAAAPLPADVSLIRSYACPTDVAEPQAAWNPDTYQLVLRVEHGFLLFREGRDRREVFLAGDRRETGFPAWINASQFVFGPLANTLHLADGRVVSSTDGLSIVTVTDNGFRSTVVNAAFSGKGFRPRPWGAERVVASSEDRLLSYDARGRASEIGTGFHPEPQPGGEGLCWRETPYPFEDPWTGVEPPGRLFIRWRPGAITAVARGIQACWTADGRVVATVMRPGPLPARWLEGETDVVLVERDGSVRTIGPGCRDPQAHPTLPLVAMGERAGGVRIASLDQAGPSQLLVADGRQPRWSADGLRLAVVESPAREDAGGSVVRVHVLRISQPGPR